MFSMYILSYKLFGSRLGAVNLSLEANGISNEAHGSRKLASLKGGIDEWDVVGSRMANVVNDSAYLWHLKLMAADIYDLKVKIGEYNSNGKFLGFSNSYSVGNGTFGWSDVNIPYHPSNGNVSRAQLQVIHGNDMVVNHSNKLWIDDFRLFEAGPYDQLDKTIKINPTSYAIQLNSGKPCFLLLDQAYDSSWAAIFNGEVTRSQPVLGILNGFLEEETVMDKLYLTFTPQDRFSLLFFVSILSSVIYVGLILFSKH